MINTKPIIVFDFETGGLDHEFHEAIQIAGKAYDGRTLQPYPQGEFNSLMKPMYFDRLSPEALKVNGKTVEMLEKAPDQKVVWLQFVAWVNGYNRGDRGGKKTKWSAPIAAGKNIREFDMKFVNALNRLHCPNGEKTVLFNTRRQIDLEDFIFAWFENEAEPSDEKMDTLRDYFGMSHDNSHDALTDVMQTGELIMRFLSCHRDLQAREGNDGKLLKFKGACSRRPLPQYQA